MSATIKPCLQVGGSTLKRILSSVLFLACVPFVFVVAVAIGLWAIWTKPEEQCMDKIADPNGMIEKPIN